MVNIIVSPYTIEDIYKLKQAGATSIIVGSDFFSVSNVADFKEDEIRQVKQICVDLHMQCYVLMNRFFMSHELKEVRRYLQFLKDLQVDGIYFTDMGIYYEAKQLGMESILIYNPDTMLTNHKDVQAYLNLGVKMGTISKEITLEDMVQIAHKVKGEMEVVIHGRLNMMHSKRMLLSNYMRFLKKDITIQNDKTLYLMEEHRDEHMPIFEDSQGTHIYTGFTLASFEEVVDLVGAGIHNLRIETMFLDIEEVCQIIQDYLYVLVHPHEGREMFKKYEASRIEQHISKGFLYKKTGATK